MKVLQWQGKEILLPRLPFRPRQGRLHRPRKGKGSYWRPRGRKALRQSLEEWEADRETGGSTVEKRINSPF